MEKNQKKNQAAIGKPKKQKKTKKKKKPQRKSRPLKFYSIQEATRVLLALGTEIKIMAPTYILLFLNSNDECISMDISNHATCFSLENCCSRWSMQCNATLLSLRTTTINTTLGDYHDQIHASLFTTNSSISTERISIKAGPKKTSVLRQLPRPPANSNVSKFPRYFQVQPRVTFTREEPVQVLW